MTFILCSIITEMIKTNIAREYPNHITKSLISDQTLYLSDYTNQTNQTNHARGVEIFEVAPPSDIDSFELKNDNNLYVCHIIFDNTSFTRQDGSTLSQCECVVFPENSDTDSWIFFAELKYCSNSYWNNNHLRKAIKQLYKTRYYYFEKCIFSRTNTCYLIASLPMQAEPFVQTVITQNDLLKLKRKHNIVLRLQNHAEIQNDRTINV
jgi:hypothetical protein